MTPPSEPFTRFSRFLNDAFWFTFGGLVILAAAVGVIGGYLLNVYKLSEMPLVVTTEYLLRFVGVVTPWGCIMGWF